MSSDTPVAGPDVEALTGIAEGLLELAEPGEEMEVVLGRYATTSARSYGGEVEALTVADTAAIGVRLVSDGRLGFASAGSLDDDVMRAVVADARENMAFAAPDEHVAIARPDGVEPVVQDLWDDSVLSTSTDDKVAMAIELERQVLRADERIYGVRNAAYGDRAGGSVIVTTTGISTVGRSTSASVGVSALAREGDDTQTGFGSDAHRGVAEIDLEKAASEAVEQATKLLGATQPSSQRVTLVLEPKLVASLLSIVGGMLSGDRVLKGRSPFADRIGEAVAHAGLTLVDDPQDVLSFGARTYDSEGLASRRTELIVGGVLQGFLYDTITASKAGERSTASAVRGVRSTPGVGWHALHVNAGEVAFEALVADVQNGVLLASMSGLHSGVNAVSGDFSVGISGQMIRNGVVAEPIREATVASTLPRLISEIAGVGSDLEHLPSGITTPSMSFANVSLSGR